GVHHLGGHGAFPDEFVEPEFIGGQRVLDHRRGSEVVTRRADGFVCFLGRSVVGGVVPRFFRHHITTVESGGLFAGRRDGLRRQDDRVGTHVGDVTVFIQSLDRKSTRLNSSHVSISYAVF